MTETDIKLNAGASEILDPADGTPTGLYKGQLFTIDGFTPRLWWDCDDEPGHASRTMALDCAIEHYDEILPMVLAQLEKERAELPPFPWDVVTAGGTILRKCGVCSALVLPVQADIERHEDFHRKLDDAMHPMAVMMPGPGSLLGMLAGQLPPEAVEEFRAGMDEALGITPA